MIHTVVTILIHEYIQGYSSDIVDVYNLNCLSDILLNSERIDD